MKNKNNSISFGILFKSTLVALLLGVSFTSRSQIITTFAGNGYYNNINGDGAYSGDGGPATAAELYSPRYIAFDASGNAYISDVENYRVRKVNTSGIISTFAGSGAYGTYSGNGGPATAAEFNFTAGIAVDASGNVYIGDEDNYRIQKVNTSGIISTFAGNGKLGFTGDGGPATAAEIRSPYGVATDASGNVYIVDYNNQRIRVVNTSGIINTFAGNGTSGYSGDGGLATAAELKNPQGVRADASGNVYIADVGNDLIRMVNTSGIISTFAGLVTGGGAAGHAGFAGDGGPATAAELKGPSDIAVDASGNVYIADVSNQRIRVVNTSGIIATLAGNGSQGYSSDGGLAAQTELDDPYGVAVDASGNVYIADYYVSNRVREVVPSFNVLATGVNIDCLGANDGSASATPYDGISPYTYSWSPGGQTTSVIIGLSAGTYTVTLTENGGTTATAAVTITQPSPFSFTASTRTNETCNGASTGQVTVTASGGTSPYTYLWSPGGGTTALYKTRSAGTYTVTVSDNCGASGSATTTITQPNALSVTTTIISGSGCGGGTNGSASVTANGGSTPYTYSWSSGGGNSSTISGLSAGIYTVTVQDKCGALITASANIEPLTVSAFAGANVSCYGGSNGQAKVSASGGKAPFTYSWSPIANSTYILNGLAIGTYSVLVTDNHGCNGVSAVTITQPTALRDSVATISYPSCVAPTGSATIGVQGGTSPYRYTWSPNISTTNSATGLITRSYAVQVKDNNSCWNTLNFSISQPPVLRDSIVRSTIVNTACSSSGSATVGVRYGTSPYTYSWSPAGGNSSTANGLSAGTYTITVNDAGSCTASTSVTIIQVIRPSLIATAYMGANVSCNGGSNGQAKVSVTGGSTPYTYSWNSGSNTYIANGLSAGTYTVTITDNCGSSASSSATISQPALLVDSVASLNYPPCTGGTGNATIGVIGGTSPYRYTWSPNVSSTDSASGLTKRSYVVQVKDNNNCWNNITISITSCANPPTATYPKGIHSDKGNEASCCPIPDNTNLYPNPNTGQFTLSGLQKGMILEMYDYTGKKITSITTTNETMQLNIFNQADGVYLIRILDKGGNLVTEKKVVKTQ